MSQTRSLIPSPRTLSVLHHRASPPRRARSLAAGALCALLLAAGAARATPLPVPASPDPERPGGLVAMVAHWVFELLAPPFSTTRTRASKVAPPPAADGATDSRLGAKPTYDPTRRAGGTMDPDG